ncbi:PREDICTED: sulfide:quinone oxidoreductase, mitochondrial-like [Priapulus caudatus]|uniref:Sulfide:quinone oxidoreductase, mitochondrial-like n=1 Tax=Priapulus caudatus TaxID=37621 RepID=A0ABM1EAY3_PRICU|nr:PREDICTED: sulfide:quinone oxidoreductase, mitochondrial-like [Priapulus caudatus]
MSASAFLPAAVNFRPLMFKLNVSSKFVRHCRRHQRFSTSRSLNADSYEVVVVGGGAGGASLSNIFARKSKSVAVIEPNPEHYYQPLWTLVGAGIMNFGKSARPMAAVLPKRATWVKDKVAEFNPKDNTVTTEGGKQIKYEYLIVGPGIQLNYNQIKGLPEAFETPGVGSNYSKLYVGKTTEALQRFNGGDALFTFPNTPIKCAGAPQKIMYLADALWTKNGVRSKSQLHYNTSLGVIFGVKKYADVLTEITRQRNLNVNFKRNLIEVKPDTQEAVFEILDSSETPKETVTAHYDFLHVVPPMSAPDCVRNNKDIVDAAGWLDVDKDTLQHKKFANIFGIGDCTNLPTSKTAAAVACQIGIVKRNLLQVMAGDKPTSVYNGYTSCPIVTGNQKCIFAEFDYNAQPMETFPFNQAKERRSMYIMKKDIIPYVYFHVMLKGYWEGPGIIRKMFRLGMA